VQAHLAVSAKKLEYWAQRAVLAERWLENYW